MDFCQQMQICVCVHKGQHFVVNSIWELNSLSLQVSFSTFISLSILFDLSIFKTL